MTFYLFYICLYWVIRCSFCILKYLSSLLFNLEKSLYKPSGFLGYKINIVPLGKTKAKPPFLLMIPFYFGHVMLARDPSCRFLKTCVLLEGIAQVPLESLQFNEWCCSHSLQVSVFLSLHLSGPLSLSIFIGLKKWVLYVLFSILHASPSIWFLFLIFLKDFNPCLMLYK